MKRLVIIALSTLAFSCSKKDEKITTFQVSGNCGMCKVTIENSVKSQNGIYSANWNMDSKLLEVKHDSIAITSKQIAAFVSGAGYDNEYFKATSKIYDQLPECCKYRNE